MILVCTRKTCKYETNDGDNGDICPVCEAGILRAPGFNWDSAR